MRVRGGRILGTLALGLLVAELAVAAPQSDRGKATLTRWESSLSVGGTSNHRLGLIKTIWWFALPDILALGLGLDAIFEEPMWFSVSAALNAPTRTVKPFICATAGGSLSGTSITRYGGGLKIRLTGKLSLLAEYRRSRYTRAAPQNDDVKEKVSADYFGAGISWTY